jgi:hypothetical protein
MILSSSIASVLSLPPAVHCVHFGLEEFGWGIAAEATLRGVKELLGIGWLPHQSSHGFDDVATPVFDRALVIVIPSHILRSI